jgi:hypothetical protein
MDADAWARLSDSTLTSAIEQFHQPISHYFYSGIGLKLQRLDSDIAEIVMMEFCKYGIPILPLHDSFLVHNGWKEGLEEEMSKAFQTTVGSSAFVRTKENSKIEKVNKGDKNTGEINFVTDNIYELLQHTETGHAKRLQEFRLMINN